jgi:hypothetical protein
MWTLLSRNFEIGKADPTPSVSLDVYPALIKAGDSFKIDLVTNDVNILKSNPPIVLLSTSKLNERSRNISLNYNDILSQSRAMSVFSTTIQTIFSEISASLDSPYLNVNPDDQIVILYGGSVNVFASVNIMGEIQILAPIVARIGQKLNFSIKDPFVSGPNFRIGSINASVSVTCLVPSGAAGSGRPVQGNETVLLFETSPDSHLFTGYLSTYELEGSRSLHAISGDGAVDLQGATAPSMIGACSDDYVVISYKNVSAAIRSEYVPKVSVSPQLVLAGQVTSILITVYQRNLSSEQNLAVSVISSNVEEPEETVQLYATSSRNGTFTGSVLLGNSTTFPLESDGFIRIFPGDDISVSLLSGLEGSLYTVRVRVATTGTLKLGPSLEQAPLDSNVATLSSGSTLMITVTDQIVESSASVLISSNSLPSMVYVRLMPTDNQAGIFTGSYEPTHSSSIAPLTVIYTDENPVSGPALNVTAVAKFAFEGLVNCTSNEGPAIFSENSTLYITVVDSDMDQNTLVPDKTFDLYRSNFINQSFSVITASTFNDTEAIQLTENDISSGIFTGLIKTTSDSRNHSGSLYVSAPGTQITVTYFDQFPHIIRQSFMRQQSVGSIYISPYNALEGHEIRITVVDPDLDTDVYASEVAQVTITDSANKSNTVLLYEQGLSASNFTGIILLSTLSSTMTANTFYSTPGTLLSTTYIDGSPPGNRTPTEHPRLGTVGSLTASPRIVSAFSLISVTVFDLDLNTDRTKIEYYSQLVSIQLYSGISYLSLSEVSSSSGTFTGILNATLGIGESSNQIPLLYGSDTTPIVVTYTDQTFNSTPKSLILQANSVGDISITQAGANNGRIVIGEPITITVWDSDAGINMSLAEYVNVRIVSSGFSSSALLQETGLTTGIFTGLYGTSQTFVDGLLSPVLAGDVITSVYSDLNPVSIINDTCVAYIAPVLSVTPSYLLSTTSLLTVTVIDPEFNTGATSYESSNSYLSLQLGLSNPIFQTITENALNSGIFTALVTLPALPTCSNQYCSVELEYSKGDSAQARSSHLSLIVGTDGGDGYGNGPILSTSALPIRQITCPASLEFGGSCGPSLSYCADESFCGNVPGFMASNAGPNILMISAGSSLRITVVDLDKDLNPFDVNYVSVAIQNLNYAGSSSSLVLQENSNQSGIFTGLFLVDYDRNSTNVTSVAGDVLQITYTDQPTSNSTLAVQRIRKANILTQGDAGIIYMNGTFRIENATPPQIFAGGILYLELQDNDLNLNANINESAIIQVHLVSQDGQLNRLKEQSLLVRETNPNSGIFRGTLPTALESYTCEGLSFTSADVLLCSQSEDSEQIQSGAMSVSAGDEIICMYYDSAPALLVTAAIRVAPAMTGIIVVSPIYIVPGANITLMVTDSDANLNSLVIDKISIFASSQNRTLVIVLVESGSNTGQFTGTARTTGSLIPIEYPSSIQGIIGSKVAFEYQDALPMQRSILSTVYFATPSILIVSDAKENSRFSISVIDTDSSRTHDVTFAIIKVSWLGNESVTNTSLSKSSINSDMFFAELLTTSTYPPAIGLIFAPAGSSMNIWYTNRNSPSLFVNVTKIVNSAFAANIKMSPSPIRVGEKLTIILEDQDVNTNLTVENSHVTILHNRSLAEISVILTETNVNSGIFTSVVSTADGKSFWTEDPHEIYISQNDILVVQYQEAAPERIVSGFNKVTNSDAGSLNCTPNVLSMGSAVYITVTDGDLNLQTDLSEACQINVVINNLNMGTLMLQENNIDSAVFTGIIQSVNREIPAFGSNVSESYRFGYPSAVRLMDLKVGDVLELMYQDVAPIQLSKRTISVLESYIGSVEIGLPTGQLQYSQDLWIRTARAGDSIPITVVDADLNQDINGVETAKVFAASSTGQIREILLSETASNASMFTGVLTTIESTVVHDSLYTESIDGVEGSLVTCIYNDKAPQLQRRSRSVIRFEMKSNISIPLPYIRAGELITLTLTDSDLDISDSVQTAEVKVVSLSDEETLQLLETSGTSGQFTGILQTVLLYSDAAPNSGVLDVIPDSMLSASYSDPSSVSPRSALITVLRSQDGTLSSSPLHVTQNSGPLHGAVSITVNDLDWDFAATNLVGCDVWISLSKGTATMQELMQAAQIGVRLQKIEPSRGAFSGIIMIRSEGFLNTSEIVQKYCLHGARDWGICNFHNDCGGSALCNRTLYSSLSNIGLASGLTYTIIYKDVRPAGTALLSTTFTVHASGTIEAIPKILIAGDPVRITVRNAGYSGRAEALVVKASKSAALGLYVAVPVSETGALTGIFTGTLATVEGNGPNGTSLGLAEGDVVTITSDKSEIDLLDLSVQILVASKAKLIVHPSTLRANGVWGITVIDPDQTTNSTCIVSISSFDEVTNAYSSGVTITLVENGPGSGIFTAKVINAESGQFSAISKNASTDFTVLAGVHVLNIINVTFQDFLPKSLSWVASKILNSALGEINLSPRSLDGQTLSLAITDRDQDYNYTQTDLISVQLYSSSTRDQETVVLVETGYHTGYFTGIMPSSSNSSEQYLNNGVLETGTNEFVTCTYEDKAPVATQSAITAFASSHQGVLSISPTHFAVGDSVIVSVTDFDRPDVVNISITSTTSSETMLITLVNTYQAGLFSGVVNVSLDIEGGSNISFAYQDFAPHTTVSRTFQSCYEGSITIEPIIVAIGYSAKLIVSDGDLKDTAAIRCTVMSLDTLVSVEVELRTSPLTSTFDGVLLLTNTSDRGMGSAGIVTLGVSPGDHLLVMYNDSCPIRTRTAFAKVQYAGTIQVSPENLLSGGKLLITVNDLDMNGQVFVNCTSGESWRALALSETGAGTGLFQGYLTTLSSTDFCRPGFEIYCNYADSSPPNILIAKAHVQDSTPGKLYIGTEVILDGCIVTVYLEDKDLLTSQQVVVARTKYGAWPIVLQRMNSTTNVFVGMVSTASSASNAVVSTAQVILLLGDFMYIDYEDSAPYSNVSIRIPVVKSAAGYIQFYPDPVSADSIIYVVVVDSDLNKNSSRMEQLAVTVTVAESGGAISLSVLLLESNLDSDVFKGSFRTRQLGGGQQNGTLAVIIGQSITAIYPEEAPFGLRSATVLVTATKLASFLVFPSPAIPGAPLQITLINSGIDSESVTVSVTSNALDLTLQSIGALGSIRLSTLNYQNYSATVYPLLPIEAKTARNNLNQMNVIDVEYGDVIYLSFLDFTPLSLVTHRLKVADIGTVSAPSVLKRDGEILVTLDDADINADPFLMERGFVQVRSMNGTAVMSLNLTESGMDSSRFTGLLRISASQNFTSGILAPVEVGANVTISYTDAIPQGFSSVSVIVGPSFASILTVNSRRINLGDDIMISLVDSDLPESEFVSESVPITVFSSRSPELARVKTLNLFETQKNSPGAFSGILRTTYGELNGLVDNDDFDVSGGDILTVQYHDTAPSSTYTIPVKVAKLGSITISPTVVNDYGTFTVTVNDFDLNLYSTVSEIWSDSVVVSVGESSVSVPVAETGLDSSVFTGVISSIPMRTTAPGYLQQATQGSIITAVYLDLYPGYGPAVPVSAKTLVATNGSVSISPNTIMTDADMFITVLDQDASFNASLVELITVSAASWCSTEFVNRGGFPQCTYDTVNSKIKSFALVVLQETAPASGEFTGKVRLFSIQNSTNTYASLRAPSGSLVKVVYNDSFPSPALQRVAQKQVTTIGLVFADPSPVNENTEFTITVTDPDLDISDDRDTNWYVAA